MDLWQSVRANAPALVEELITDGQVNVNERNDLGETALHLACSRGFDDVASLLLAHGADVALQDWESGWTALHRSAHNAHLSTSLLLLRHARQHHGRQFMKTFLYDTRDFANQSAMQLVSSHTRLGVHVDNQEHMKENQGEEEEEEEGEEPELEEDEHTQWRAASMERRGGMVYTFGKVDFQLGYHLPHVNVQSSPRLVELPITSPIVQISASKFHTIALNDRGQVYVWGFGKGGRLGTGTEFDHVEPTRLTLLDEIPIAQVAAGENHTLALSRSGQVFSWGSNSFGQLGHNVKASTHESRLTPKRIDAFKGMRMIGIAASGMHSGAICESGFVYTWGSNKRGQLGRKDGFGVEQPNPTPKRVDRLVPGHALSVLYEPHDEMRVVQVAMSDVHTCVVLQCSKNGQKRGQVWQFGYGSNVPTRIVFKEKRRTNSMLLNDAWLPRWKLHSNDIVSISCAPNHSIALSACGSVYTWGHNGDALSHQQAKAKDFIPPGAPQRVMLDKYGPIVSICASQDHCAVVTRSGDLVSWGGGPQGVLGHGPGNSWQPSPKQVHGAKKVVSVAAGHQHTVVLVAPRLPEERRETANATSSPPKLRNLLESKIAGFLDISNVATVWKYASTYSQLSLARYCLEYMQLNWDAMLEMGTKERLDTLFELMLSPTPKVVRSMVIAVEEDRSVKVKASERKPERKSSISAAETKSVPSKPEADVEAVKAQVGLTPPSPLMKPQPPAATPAPASARHVKGAKFVSVDSFFSEKVDDVRAKQAPATSKQTFISPWSVPKASGTAKQSPPSSAARQADVSQLKAGGSDVFPTLGDAVSRPPRKQSMEHHISHPRKSPVLGASPSPTLSFKPATSSPLPIPRTHALGHDGSERPQMTSFSLDAFIKKSSRKKLRSDSIDLAKPTWGGAAMAAPENPTTPAMATHKSLKQIQEEEESRAKTEAAAKAKNGGFVRKASSFNSWGLVQQQHHISLAELQKREEDERFMEEQRQIMAQIERENRQRQADDKRKAAKQEKAKKAEPKENKGNAANKPKKQQEKLPSKETLNKDATQQPKPKQQKKKPDQPRQNKPRKASADVTPSVKSEKKDPRPNPRKKTSKPALPVPAPAPGVMAA